MRKIMRVGVILPSGEWPDVLAAAHRAVEAGADSIWVNDSFANGALETITQMTALASDIPDVEVGAYMLNPSLRDHTLLAAMLASMNTIAPGRIRVLLGTGWQRADYEALGVAFPAPDRRLADARHALCALKERGVPVEVAGVRDDIVRLAAELADGWAVSADALDAFFERMAFFQELAGRRAADVRVAATVRCGDVEARAEALAANGVDEIRLEGPYDPGAVGRLAKRRGDAMTTQQVTTGLAEVNGTTIYHETRGEGPPVVLIAGGGSDAGVWDPIAERLASDHTVIAYDRRGLSRSPRPEGWTSTSIEEQADDCAELIDALGLDRPIVVGHSLGGSIIVSMLERHADKIRGAVLYEPGLSSVTTSIDAFIAEMTKVITEAAAAGPDAIMEAMGRLILGEGEYDAFLDAMPKDVERMKANQEVNALEVAAEPAFHPDAEALGKAGVPVHGLLGASTQHEWLIESTRWAVEATNGTLHTVPGGHGGFILDPDGFVDVLRSVLASMP